MSITWSSAPREILEIIFKNLKEEYHLTDFDIRECSLVCRRWSSPAQELIFSNIQLNSEGEFERIIYTVACKPSLSRYIKELHYNYNETTANRQMAHLAVISRFFPELEVFDSSGFIDDCYYELFCNLIEDGKFPNLKKYPKTWNPHQDSLRASCLISHAKKSITAISIFRFDDTGRNEYNLLCNELPHFSRLDILDISINSDIPQSVIDYIESVTPLKIRELELVLNFPDNSNFEKQDLNKITPMLSIKNISTHLWRALNITHDDYIFYLMKKFPNLESLHLMFHDHWFIQLKEHNSANKISTPTFINQLFTYLSKLLEYSIKCCYTHIDNVCYLIDQFFLNSVAGRKHSTHLSLQTTWSRPDNQTGSIAYIDFTQVKRQIRTISVQVFPQDYRLFCFDILKSVGHHFVGLEIDGNTVTDLAVFLTHISEHCPNIESLGISGNMYVGSIENHTDYQIHSSLKTLTLNHGFSSELFSFVSIQFPYIEKLVLSYCYSPEDDMIRAYSSNEFHDTTAVIKNNKIFDMFNFSVKHLVIDVIVDDYEIYENRLKHVYIKTITHADGKTRYFNLLAPSPTEEFPKKKPALELLEDPNEVEYERSIGDQIYLVYEVKCKSVEKITIIEHPVNFEDISIEFNVL